MKLLSLLENTSKIIKIINFPELRQIYNYDCGASAVQSVLCYYGFDEREDKILKALSAKHTEIFNNGVYLSDIVNYLNNHKLTAKIITNLSISNLIKYIDKDIPVIVLLQAWHDSDVQVKWIDDYRDGHYVVAIGYTKNCIIFEDPSDFNRTFLTFNELKLRWHAIDDNGNKQKNSECIVVEGIPKYNKNKIVHMN